MLRLFHTHAVRALLLTVPLASACTTAGSFQTGESMGHVVLVDGVRVLSQYSNLFELLTAKTPVVRFGRSPLTPPLVVMDGVRTVMSLAGLEDVRVADVRSVRFVRSIDATFLYGGAASQGAIVIETVRRR